ncbi:hypothetical protein ABMA28_011985 [Loxostege sticticalis]|uniref:Uncharacterized protein n=1 Tax=Loxostege sticticalis TaxID=481309 RepID=A0ABD0TLG4_LOXSC
MWRACRVAQLDPLRSAVGLFTPASSHLGGGRGDSGGCVAERARVPGRFVIATEAVVCRRWPVRALVPHRSAPLATAPPARESCCCILTSTRRGYSRARALLPRAK